MSLAYAPYQPKPYELADSEYPVRGEGYLVTTNYGRIIAQCQSGYEAEFVAHQLNYAFHVSRPAPNYSLLELGPDVAVRMTEQFNGSIKISPHRD